MRGTLTRLGYRDRNGAWRHRDHSRRCVFLGDFIDRGPNNADVLNIVRRMIDAGTAVAVMGNHELNAIHFHTEHPDTGSPLRLRSEKNVRQHESFLAEFPAGDPVVVAIDQGVVEDHRHGPAVAGQKPGKGEPGHRLRPGETMFT